MLVPLAPLLLCGLALGAAPKTKERSRVLIVGGGPVGLSTALMLRNRGWRDITVVERLPQTFDSERSYMYMLDGRGQRLTDLLGLTGVMAESGVPIREFTNITYVLPHGATSVFKFPWSSVTSAEKFYLPRKEMVELLTKTAETKGIPVHFGCSTQSIVCDASSSAVKVTCVQRDASGERMLTFEPNIVIGCDGYQSTTRDFLCNTGLPDASKFLPRLSESDSSKLCYKILRMNSRFSLPDGNMSVPSRGYVFVGEKGKPNTRIRLGLLPVRSSSFRTANIICGSDHVLWNMSTKEEVKAFLSRAFPQLHPLEEYFSDDELERFAKLKPGRFPEPSSVSKCQQRVSDTTTFLLAGDAVHSFPPDIGQGINSGFLDVYHLHSALEKTSDDFDRAAEMYERVVIPESKALAEIVRYAATAQYGNAPIKRLLFGLNLKFREIIAKMVPSVFAPAAFYLVQNPSMTYSDINRLAHRTTRRIWMATSLLIILFSVTFKLLRSSRLLML